MRYGGIRYCPDTCLGVGVRWLDASNQRVAFTDFARLLPAYCYAARPFTTSTSDEHEIVIHVHKIDQYFLE